MQKRQKPHLSVNGQYSGVTDSPRSPCQNEGECMGSNSLRPVLPDATNTDSLDQAYKLVMQPR
jgi:hypothetical protein